MITKPGRYYAVTAGGLVPVGDVAMPPDVVICRRVADFDRGVPEGAGRAVCAQCGEPIAFNLGTPHQTIPKICNQCAGITPLPMDGEPR